MRPAQAEKAALLAGAVVLLAGMALWVPQGVPAPQQLAAQALLFGVLLCAVFFGRRGGFVAAVAASVGYLLLRMPELASHDLAAVALFAIIARMLSFGALGIVGGELFTRLSYNLTRLDGGSALDEWSRVYNQRYLHAILAQGASRHARYGEPLSVAVISVPAETGRGAGPTRARTVVRHAADHIRADVRMVDAVGRLDDGRFVVVMPHTPAAGGQVVAARLAQGLRPVFDPAGEAVSARCLSLPTDADALAALIDSIRPAEAEDQFDASGVYSSAASITRNPADRRTSSAPSVSTLNTSTAASPDGSTKQ